MVSEYENPFSVTKATEFSDQEINEYWVNFNTKDNISIDSILNPNEYLPKYIIGGKGCGKTHILRYFSYPLQKIRNPNITDLLSKEGYLGLYSVFYGINSSRFTGKGIDDSEWGAIFEYYFELYICDNLLSCLKDVLSMLDMSSHEEAKLVSKIVAIFSNTDELSNCLSIQSLTEFLTILRRKIDFQIQNAAFTRKLDYKDVSVLFSPGDLLFGIPKIMAESHRLLSDIKFIYIFDEYEKLYEWQKKFINTLVWDKKNPVTFWIGARKYGFTTRETKSGQEMKSGSEFENINLDTIIRNNEDLYKEFAEKLFTDRLERYYSKRGLEISPQEIKQQFHEKFEKYDENRILNEIREKNTKKEYEHLREFRKKITSAIKSNHALEVKSLKEIDSIILSIAKNTNNNPLYQKYKLFYFYRLWNKAKQGDTIKKFLNEINKEFLKFTQGKDSEFDEIKDKRKKDFIAQLAKENNVKNTEYSGLSRFIELSQGNARHFILILKRAIEYSRIRGERPLEIGGKIGLDAQYFAVYDTAKWFYDDIEVVGESGKEMYSSLKNLTDYFIQERFCDKPVETTVSCFYVKADELSEKASDCLDLMTMHSVLIEDEEGRYDRNTGRKERLFQLNKILAPLWNLPTVVRGSISLNNDIAEAIFNYNFNSKFKKLYMIRKSQLNAPEFLKRKSQDSTLFD